MIIRSQDKAKIADTRSVPMMIKADKNGGFDVIGLKDGIRFIMGRYEKQQTALDVIDIIWELILNGQSDAYFDMPEDVKGAKV